MCIIIYKPKEEVLTEEGLTLSWDNNPDGGGVSYAKHGRIHTFKTMDQAEWVDYILAHNDEELVVHARFTTKGATNLQNCHPFATGKDSVCFMNGTMTHIPEEKVRSDTRIFCEDIATMLPDDWCDNPAVTELVRNYAGEAKLVFMYTDGRVNILNEHLGKWVNGCWHSNEWYSEERYPTYRSPAYDSYLGESEDYWKDRLSTRYDDAYDDDGNRRREGAGPYGGLYMKCQACDTELETYAEQVDGICEDCDEILYGDRFDVPKDDSDLSIHEMTDEQVEALMS